MRETAWRETRPPSAGASMNLPGSLRIAAYVLAWLIATLPALAANRSALSPDPAWHEPLQRAEAMLAGGDARRAQEAWEEAYRAAVRSHTPQGALEVGRAYLRIGEAARDHQTALAGARRLYLTALFQARERRDALGVAEAAGAFAALGDREVADGGFAVAIALAERNVDIAARNRIAALQRRSSAER
jgi:hypothetical protein